VQTAPVEHAILEEAFSEQGGQFADIAETPELVVVIGEEREFRALRYVLRGDDADFGAHDGSVRKNRLPCVDRLQDKEQSHVILLVWFD
jgi:hypothetical protein